MSQQRENVDEYWREMSSTLGETVLAYTLGQYREGLEVEGPLWGLFYLTETRLFFKHFPQTSWIQSLIARSSEKEEEISFEFSLNGAVLIEPPKPTLFQRIIGSYDRVHRLELSTGITILFSIETKPDDFLRALRNRTTHGKQNGST